MSYDESEALELAAIDARWLSVQFDDGRCIVHRLPPGRHTVGQRDHAAAPDIDIGVALPPGETLAISVDAGRVSMCTMGSLILQLEDGGVIAPGRDCRVEMGIAVRVGRVSLRVSRERPCTPLPPWQAMLIVLATLIMALATVSMLEPSSRSGGVTEAYVRLVEERGYAPDSLTDLATRAVRAEARGDCREARALYRAVWHDVIDDPALRTFAEQGVVRCLGDEREPLAAPADT